MLSTWLSGDKLDIPNLGSLALRFGKVILV